MDEATLAAELLADKFNTQSQEQTQFSQLQHIQTQSQITTTTAADYSGSGYPQATNGNTAASGHGEVSNEPVQAYAKLEGESFCYYIRTLQVTFGRKASSSDQVDIHLGPTKAISRQHARLFYNFTTQRFEMMVFGKNGAFVNDQFVEKGVTVPLENRTKIQIGEVSFSFLLPKLETDETTQDSAYGEGSSQKNGSQRHGNHNTINTDINSTSGSMSGGNEFPGTPTEQFDSSEYSSKDTKPPFSYASLIAQAINSTPSRKLTLNGIYQHITNHYPYYQLAQNGWQNSIRHNLSLNKAFVKVPRSDSEPGKGAFWTIDQSCENQFANGVYKRNRRAISSKPGGGRARSDSESPMDQPDKPRKRVNTGTEISVQDSPQHQHIDSSISQQQQQTQPQTGQQQSLQTTMAQKPPVANVGLNLANPLQEAPGLSALNLAALTQTITAAAKEGNQAALASALIAAANASGIPGGLAASLPATARALAAHLQQQQLLQQQQQQQQQAQQSSSSNSQTQPNQASVTTPIITPITTSSQPATTTSISAGLQTNNGQANLTSTTSNQSETVVSTSVSLPSTSVTSTPTLAIPTPAASAQGTPSSVLESISTSDSSGLSNSASTINDPSTQQSPIAQLVAAAQAQARAQALSKQQQEGKVENQQTTQTSTTIVQDTITSTNPSPTSKPTTLPEEKVSDSIAESDT